MKEPLNSFIIGFSEECSFPETIEKLAKDKIINISQWVTTNKRGTIDLFDFYHGKSFISHKINNHITSDLYDKITKYLFEFCYINPRNNISHTHINKIPSDIYSDLHEFNKFIYLIYDIFITEKIELVLFQEIPHDGAEIILYRLAKIMGIKTIIMANFTHFWGRIFAFYSLEDFGEFNEIPDLSNDAEEVTVDYDDFKKKMYYMKYVKNHNSKLDILKKIIFKIRKRYLVKLLFSPFLSDKKFNKTEFSLAAAIIQYKKTLEYSKNYREITEEKTDLSKRYIYFALHLDPEIPTTPAFAGIYSDQMIALERLSNILPDDMLIYVKENPKQTDILRSPGFFDRLKKLTNVKVVNQNTYELINNSCLVATIAGTVGWEAITGGKNVIVFGKAWYQTFPGCFKFSENMDLNEAINYKVLRPELEKAVKNILRKSGIGMVYFPFSNSNFQTDIREIYPKYNRQNNINDLCLSITKLIEYKA